MCQTVLFFKHLLIRIPEMLMAQPSLPPTGMTLQA